MYNVLLVILGLSIIIFMIEAAYVINNLSSKIHAYLFFYIICCLVNNVGYLLEMTATTSEAAYTATKLLYLGKMNIAYAFLMFILHYCKVHISKKIQFSLFTFHQVMYGIVVTNDWHHLYYSSIRFDESGLFPHNVYGHGPVYYVSMLIPYVYTIFTLVLLVRTYRKLKTVEERRQMMFLLIAPIMSMVGTLVFFTGKTQGFDSGNLGLIFSAGFMLMALFRYKLIDTVDMVKNTLADSLEDGLVAVDAYDELAYCNDKAGQILPELITAGKKEILSIVDSLEKGYKNKDMIEVEERTYAIRKQNLYQGRIYRGRLFVLADMTESIRYTKQIEAERDRADEANAAKSNFLSSMSHEIRTPMNAVVGMTDILLRNNPKDADVVYLENIKRSGNALLDIINDILDFSKIESGKMEIINDDYALLPMINDLKMIFVTRIGDKPLRMIYEIDKNLPARLYGDAVRIRQILINLVNNAIKFTDTGYVKIKIDVENNGNEIIDLKVSVSDTGQGIRQEDLNKLFQSFTQVDSQKNHTKEGTGLGLTITKQLVELMGGTISVASEYGKGTEFTFVIPQKIIDATPATEVEEKIEAVDEISFIAPEAQILLVEDNKVNTMVAQGLLKPLMLNIDVATNGLIATQMVQQKKYDLVLMDHQMPVMDGIEATAIIREMDDEYYKRLPIIALTANAVTGAKEEFLEAGMNDFVSKPIKINEILPVLKKWLPTNLVKECMFIKKSSSIS